MGVVSEIHAWNRGRERLRLKYAKMETDAFCFFRGTAHSSSATGHSTRRSTTRHSFGFAVTSISRISARFAATTGAPIST